MPLWLLLLVALFLVVAAVALIISIHILETHASQCLALDAVPASNKDSAANPGMAASATDHTCCVCGGHRKGSTDLEASSGASKSSGGLFQPMSDTLMSDVTFGKTTACAVADCLSGLTSRRTGTASGLRSGWLKTSRWPVGRGNSTGHMETSDSEQMDDEPVPDLEVVDSTPSLTSGTSTGIAFSKAVAASALSVNSASTVSDSGVTSSSAAGAMAGSIAASIASAMTSETHGDNFACVAEASAGNWGTCGSSATATITATITATPSATASGSSSGGSSSTSNAAGKQPPSRRLVLEILMAPSNTPDGQGGSLPRATGVRLKLETNGGTETLEGLAALTGGSVGGDGSLTITGAEEIAALGLNVENVANVQNTLPQRNSSSGSDGNPSGSGKGGSSQKSGVTVGKSSLKDGMSAGGGPSSSSTSGGGGKGSDMGLPSLGKWGQVQKSSAGLQHQNGSGLTGITTSGSTSNSKAGAVNMTEGKGLSSTLNGGGQVVDWGSFDEEDDHVQDPRAKKIAEEVVARKADMEVVLAAARATALARKNNNPGLPQGQPGNKGTVVKENQMTAGASKCGIHAGPRSGDVLTTGKGKTKAVMGIGSVNTNGNTGSNVASSSSLPSGQLLKSSNGVGQGISSVKQEGLDSLRLSSGELGSKGKVTKDVARGTADFASVLAALNVDSIGGKGAGLGAAIGPNGLVGGSNLGAGTANSLLLSRSGSSDSERSGKGSADEELKTEEEGCIGDGSGSDAGIEDTEEAVVISQAVEIVKKQEGDVPADEDVDESRKKDKKRGKNKRRRQKQKATNAIASGLPGSSGAASGVREFPLNITLHGQKTTELEVGCICSTPKGFAHVMGCPYPFMSNMSNIQRKIKEQYDELVKANIAKSLTLAQVGRFTTCLVDAKNTIQHKSDIIQRRFTIVKSLLSKADKSNFDRLCGQIYGLEREQKQLEEDSIVYNRMQEQLKQSPAYQKMLEYGRTHFETLPKSGQLIEKLDNEEQISFEELLAQEKKDAFWQKHSSRSSVHVV